MGADLVIQGFKPPDEKWTQMKAVYDACKKANVGIPEQVDDFFAGEAPDAHGVYVSRKELKAAIEPMENADGYIVDLRKLPAEITHLKVWNSY